MTPPAGGEHAVTLDEVSALAIGRSPLVREAEAEALAARGRALQAGLYPNPLLAQGSPQLAGNQTQYNAFITQEVVTRGKIPLGMAAAERAAQEAELAVVKARFNVLTNVRQRFYTALAAQQRVEVLDRLVAIARRAAQISERVFKADLGTRGDVLLLEIELSRAEAQRSSAAALGEAARRQLAAATGVIDLPIARVEGDLKLPLPDYDVIGVQQAVLARNSQLRSAELEIARSQLVLRRQEVEPFPNLNLMGGYQNQQPGAGAPQSQGMYQVEMVVPLFNRNQGNIRAAQASVGTAMARLQRVQTELADAAAAAVGRYQAARQILDRYEREILPKARRLEGIYSGLYAEAQVDFLRYLAAQRALLDADLSSVNAQEARWMAAVEIAGLLQAERFP